MSFRVDWEHHFGADTPAYLQVTRGDLTLHLSEHHGDGTPGTIVYVETLGVEELHAELSARTYKYLRPDIYDTQWGTRNLTVIDPFNNRLSFNEHLG